MENSIIVLADYYKVVRKQDKQSCVIVKLRNSLNEQERALRWFCDKNHQKIREIVLLRGRIRRLEKLIREKSA